ncbi:MAG: HNH endonuclease [Actinobacteria bacterium]|nr:HNH endonuclease [Actinomycetota bacterium]
MERNWRQNKQGYYYCYESGAKLYRHRAVYEQHHGPIPEGYYVHHKNGVKGDDRPENLMVVTPKGHKRYHPRERLQRTCAVCHGDFEGTRNAKYCPSCRSRAYEATRKLTTRRCRHCGASFTTRSGNYCSQRCVNLGARWKGVQPRD